MRQVLYGSKSAEVTRKAATKRVAAKVVKA